MKEMLNKKYTITCKQMLIESLISSILFTIVLYIIFGVLNADLTRIMQGIAKDGTALDFCIIAFPIVLIINIMYVLGKIVVKGK